MTVLKTRFDLSSLGALAAFGVYLGVVFLG